MIALDIHQLTSHERAKLLKGVIVPRPIVFITSLSESGVLNGAPFSYFSLLSTEPPLISVSIQRSETGELKDSSRNILQQKAFVVHVVDETNIQQVNATAAHLPPDISEIDLVGFTTVDSLQISVSGIAEAKVRLECILEQSLPLGDETKPSCDLIIARIVQCHIDEKVYQQGCIDTTVLAPIGKLAGNNYTKLGQLFQIQRPT